MLSETAMNQDTVLSRLKEGDKEALSDLYEMYWEGMMSSCFRVIQNKEECEDLVQDVFMLIWEKRKTLQIEGNLAPYMFGILRFKVFNHLKVNHRKSEAFRNMADVFTSEEGFPETPETVLEHKETYISVMSIISGLPERCKLVYELREENLSYQDIATQLNISVKTVENQLLKARKQLRFSLRHFLMTATPFFVLFFG